MVELGALSVPDIIKKMDEDLSDKDAYKQFIENQSVNSDVKGDE
jgi:hypothetical protein